MTCFWGLEYETLKNKKKTSSLLFHLRLLGKVKILMEQHRIRMTLTANVVFAQEKYFKC